VSDPAAAPGAVIRIRILVCDDHPIVRSGLIGLLASQPDFDVIGEAGDGFEALARVKLDAPDIVLMDLRMPAVATVRDGVAAIEAIRAAAPETRVLVVTTYDADRDIQRALDAGADGYLLKDMPREQLYGAIRAVTAGRRQVDPRINARLPALTDGADVLSAREIEVLQRVAAGLGNKEIGKALHISEATVKTHLIHIYGKLRVDDRAAAVAEGVRRGYLTWSS
jgi:DNA-binding NarL/FixJ family response regulator